MGSYGEKKPEKRLKFKAAFISDLEKEEIKYKDVDERCVRISYTADNTDDITINVIFDEDDEGLVAFKCWSFGKVPAKKRDKVLESCNDLNAEYRWVKFFIDGDDDVTADSDAIVDLDTVGSECIQMVRRMVNIIDEAYPRVMKAFWG